LNLLKIKNQSLSSVIVVPFQICQFCKIVDTDKNRSRIGYPCPTCGKPSPGGLMFYDLLVHVVVNLMQESYKITHERKQEVFFKLDTHYVSIVIFFCTLKEMLLTRFLENLLDAENIPPRVRKRLMDDNRFYIQQLEKLFPSLTGKTWSKTISELSKETGIDFVSLNPFLEEASNKRNTFIHRGNKWKITEQLAKDCILKSKTLLELYMMLHNKYIASHYQ